MNQFQFSDLTWINSSVLFKQQWLGFRHKVHVFFMKVELIF